MRDCVSHSQGQEQGPWAARTMWFIVTSWGSFQNVKSSNGEPAKTRGPPKLLLPSLWETPCPKAMAVTGLSPALQTAQEPSFPPFVSLPAVTRWKAAFPLASQDGQEDADSHGHRCLGRCSTFPHAGRGVTADQQRDIYLFPHLGSAYFLFCSSTHAALQSCSSWQRNPGMPVPQKASPGEHIFAVLCIFPLTDLVFKVFPHQ